MILIDNVKKDRGAFLKVADYLWGGFSGLATIALIIALWQIGSELGGEFLLPAPGAVFVRAYELLADYKNSEINITLVR